MTTVNLLECVPVPEMEWLRRCTPSWQMSLPWDRWMALPINGHEFEQAPGVGEGQGSLQCCNIWGCKEWEMTEELNLTGRNVGGKN